MDCKIFSQNRKMRFCVISNVNLWPLLTDLYHFSAYFIFWVPKIHTKIQVAKSKTRTNLENNYTHRGAYFPHAYVWIKCMHFYNFEMKVRCFAQGCMMVADSSFLWVKNKLSKCCMWARELIFFVRLITCSTPPQSPVIHCDLAPLFDG